MGIVWIKIVLLLAKINVSRANKDLSQMKMEYAGNLIPTVLHPLMEDANPAHLVFMLIKPVNVNHCHKTVSLQT